MGIHIQAYFCSGNLFFSKYIMKLIILLSALMAIAYAAPEAEADAARFYNRHYGHYGGYGLGGYLNHYRGYYGLANYSPYAAFRHPFAHGGYYRFKRSADSAAAPTAEAEPEAEAQAEASALFGSYFGSPYGYGYSGYPHPYHGHYTHPLERISPYHGYHALYHGPYGYPFGALYQNPALAALHHHPAAASAAAAHAASLYY